MITAPGQRLVLLDVLRGLAILGTLGTNIWIFTDPAGIVGMVGRMTPRLDTPAGVVEALLRFLANGKFLALLTILFGVGLELQRRSAARRGTRWPGWYLWRMALLVLDGVLHYLLVVEFDVLMSYAVTGFVVSYLVLTSERAQRRWMIAAATVHVLVVGVLSTAFWNSPREQEPPHFTLYSEGSWGDQVAFRLDSMLLLRLESILVLPQCCFLFLLGAHLYRAGAFEFSPRGRALRRRLVRWGFGIGLPLNLATTLGAHPALMVLDRYVFPPLVALGYLGVIAWWVERRADGWTARRLAGIGRVALSCYILQNLLASALCYGWGLGLAARLAEHRVLWTPVAWSVISVTLVVFSALWLRRFRQGPVEAVWRWAAEAPRRWLDPARRVYRA